MHEVPGVLIVPVANCAPPWLANTVTVTCGTANGHVTQKFWHICGPGVTALDENVKTRSHKPAHAPARCGSSQMPVGSSTGHVQEKEYGLFMHELVGKAEPGVGNCSPMFPAPVPAPSHDGADPSNVVARSNKNKVPHVTCQYADMVSIPDVTTKQSEFQIPVLFGPPGENVSADELGKFESPSGSVIVRVAFPCGICPHAHTAVMQHEAHPMLWNFVAEKLHVSEIDSPVDGHDPP
jgi:hypothetical protein